MYNDDDLDSLFNQIDDYAQRYYQDVFKKNQVNPYHHQPEQQEVSPVEMCITGTEPGVLRFK